MKAKEQELKKHRAGVLRSKTKVIFIDINGKVEKLVVPEELTTTHDLERDPYWRESGLLDEKTAGKIKNGEVDIEDAEKILNYFRTYAAWHALKYMLANGLTVFDFDEEYLKKLWIIARKARILEANAKIKAVTKDDILKLLKMMEKTNLHPI